MLAARQGILFSFKFLAFPRPLQVFAMEIYLRNTYRYRSVSQGVVVEPSSMFSRGFTTE